MKDFPKQVFQQRRSAFSWVRQRKKRQAEVQLLHRKMRRKSKRKKNPRRRSSRPRRSGSCITSRRARKRARGESSSAATRHRDRGGSIERGISRVTSRYAQRACWNCTSDSTTSAHLISAPSARRTLTG